MLKFEANMNDIPPNSPRSIKQCNKSATAISQWCDTPGSNLAVVRHQIGRTDCWRVGQLGGDGG